MYMYAVRLLIRVHKGVVDVVRVMQYNVYCFLIGQGGSLYWVSGGEARGSDSLTRYEGLHTLLCAYLQRV